MELDDLPSTVMPLLSVTLTFDLLTSKSNQHVGELKYIGDQTWVKFPSLVFEIWGSQGFRYAQTHSRPREG